MTIRVKTYPGARSSVSMAQRWYYDLLEDGHILTSGGAWGEEGAYRAAERARTRLLEKRKRAKT